MKIERINDNQIRCVLTKTDLIERHLRISELAYGSEKAKEFFRDMMEQASIDFGFEADDIPLMIEAIPTSRDSIVLVITKVEDPAEFEKRFSHFSPESDEEIDENDEKFEIIDESDEEDEEEFVDCFDQFKDLIDHLSTSEDNEDKFIPLYETLRPDKKKKKSGKKKELYAEDSKVYSFSGLEQIIEVARIVGSYYQGKNTLWKNEVNHRYYLYLTYANKLSEYLKVCDTVGEYGTPEFVTFATKAYFDEHYKVIIRDRALLTLSIM